MVAGMWVVFIAVWRNEEELEYMFLRETMNNIYAWRKFCWMSPFLLFLFYFGKKTYERDDKSVMLWCFKKGAIAGWVYEEWKWFSEERKFILYSRYESWWYWWMILLLWKSPTHVFENFTSSLFWFLRDYSSDPDAACAFLVGESDLFLCQWQLVYIPLLSSLEKT